MHTPNVAFLLAQWGRAPWRTTVERTAMQTATAGAFQIQRPLDALNFFLADVTQARPDRVPLRRLSNDPNWVVLIDSARFRRGAPCSPDWRGTSNANELARQNGYR
jgi:hypothetical protein